MTKTLRERFIAALTLEGYQQVESRSSKYIVFKRTEGSFWYVGKSGSLRVGATIAGSIPASEKAKQFLLARAA
jgi:hypothetical protein